MVLYGGIERLEFDLAVGTWATGLRLETCAPQSLAYSEKIKYIVLSITECQPAQIWLFWAAKWYSSETSNPSKLTGVQSSLSFGKN